MATMLEAEPFIRGLRLEERGQAPFPVFGSDEAVLVVTGMGTASAAMAAAYLIMRHAPSLVCNLGAAGALERDLSLGDTLQVSRVVEPDRLHLRTGEPLTYVPDLLDGIRDATLATVDRPVLEDSDRRDLSRLARLVDMEGSGICQACKRFAVRCYLVKFVSDIGQGCDIAGNIALLRDAFFAFGRDTVLPLLLRASLRV